MTPIKFMYHVPVSPEEQHKPALTFTESYVTWAFVGYEQRGLYKAKSLSNIPKQADLNLKLHLLHQ